MSNSIVQFTREEVWEALDEVDSTGEVYEPDTTAMIDHLKAEALVEYDEIDCVWFLSGLGWKVYEKGPEGTRDVD